MTGAGSTTTSSRRTSTRTATGCACPGSSISPYARKGYVDHQILSFDAYDKFIEDDFLGGQRLDPATDGRPDPRPDVREDERILGNLTNDFDFNQAPRPPVILPVHPRTTLTGTPTRATAPRTPSSRQRLAAVVRCLETQGVTVPATATPAQFRAAFLALSRSQQLRVYAACAPTLPAKLRQRIQRYLAKHRRPHDRALAGDVERCEAAGDGNRDPGRRSGRRVAGRGGLEHGIGPGKSTVLRQFGLIDTPTSGTIHIDGRDVTALCERVRSEMRLASLGYVFHEYALLAELTAEENVYLPALMLGQCGRDHEQRARALTGHPDGPALDHSGEPWWGLASGIRRATLLRRPALSRRLRFAS